MIRQIELPLGQFLVWFAVQCVGFLISGVLLYSHFELITFIGCGFLFSAILSWMFLGYLGDLYDKYRLSRKPEDEKFLFFIVDLQIIFVWNAMIEYCFCIPFLMM